MKTTEYYDNIARGYNELYREEQLKKWKIAKKLIKFSKNDVVLDVGCGTGILTEEIFDKVKLVVGVDVSINMINLAFKHPKITYLCSKARYLPFLDNTFNKIVSLTMLQDIKNWDPTLKEISRVAKGPVLLSVLKIRKSLPAVKKKLMKFFKINNFVEEEKDYIFLLEKK